jgi:hypothetical protein
MCQELPHVTLFCEQHLFDRQVMAEIATNHPVAHQTLGKWSQAGVPVGDLLKYMFIMCWERTKSVKDSARIIANLITRAEDDLAQFVAAAASNWINSQVH